MSNFDISILKRNVRNLIENKGMTQEQLGNILNMSQSNVSKALSLQDKKCFTVEQIFLISEHFNVSLDWLLGRASAPKSLSQRDVGLMLANLLKTGDVKVKGIDIDETVYTPSIDYDLGIYEYSPHNKRIHYPAIYFPSYWNPYEGIEDEYDLQCNLAEAGQVGNDTFYAPINEFLTQFIRILQSYNDKALPEEIYQLALNEYLSKLKD